MRIGQSIIYLFILIVALLATVYVDERIKIWRADMVDTNMPDSRDVPNVPDLPDDPSVPSSNGGCYVGGCSNQLCGDTPDMVSTCEWSERYACYKEPTTKCERQSDGQCGWTPTPELDSCLLNADAMPIGEPLPELM